MTQNERLAYLIQYLTAEDDCPYKDRKVPENICDRMRLFRAMVNVRPARPVSNEFLRIQDAFLQNEIAEMGIVEAEQLPAVLSHGQISIWQGDITRLKVGAIVNAANSALLGCFAPNHKCIDNAIHTYAGVQLRLACDELMRAQGHPEPAGTAKLTDAYNLPCGHVLHTVGPIVSGALTQQDCDTLKSCYRACLELAADNGIESVAFCCISTGAFHFPPYEAAEIAVRTVTDFLASDSRVKKVVFDVFNDLDMDIYLNLLG